MISKIILHFTKIQKKMRLHNFRIQKNHQNRKINKCARDNLTQIKESNFTSVMYSHVLLVTILSIKLLATNITLKNIYFILRFGLVNSINTYLRLKIRVV